MTLNQDDVRRMQKLDDYEEAGFITEEKPGMLNALKNGLFSGKLELEEECRQTIDKIINIIEKDNE